jgi:hypothetical protein
MHGRTPRGAPREFGHQFLSICGWPRMAADQPQEERFAGFRAFSRVCSLDLFQPDSARIGLGTHWKWKRAKTREPRKEG